jgi:hypothetical protein
MNSSFYRNLIGDMIDEIAHQTELSQLAATFSVAAAKFGFTSLGINSLPAPGAGANPLIVTEATPKGFRDCYVDEEFYLVDHICAHARTAFEPFRYSEAPYASAQAPDLRDISYHATLNNNS